MDAPLNMQRAPAERTPAPTEIRTTDAKDERSRLPRPTTRPAPLQTPAAHELSLIPPLPTARGKQFFNDDLSAGQLDNLRVDCAEVQEAIAAGADAFASPKRGQNKENGEDQEEWERYFLLLPPIEDAIARGFELPFDLYPYQTEGVSFLARRRRALLADDMGLGKTAQAIVAARFLLSSGKIESALVVCPAGLKSNWKAEFERWAPEAAVAAVSGNAEKRAKQWRGPSHVWIASYETVRNDLERLPKRPFDLIILDEAQRIKNADTGVAQAVKSLRSKASWCLTGTPIENRVADLASIGQFLDPNLPFDREAEPEEARRVMSPYFLRRGKSVVMNELPEKRVADARIALSDAQQRAYRQVEQLGGSELRGMGTSVTLQHVLALITRLKQICNYDPVTKESSKLEYLRDSLKTIASRGEKALLFSQYRKTLEFIGERLEPFHPVYYHGGLSETQKNAAIEQFKAEPGARIMLISLQAGGVGLNLQEASYVYHFDRWWNPAIERQAEDRAYRLGQKRDVIVSRLIAAGTIEEKIERVLKEKEALFRRFINAGVETERPVLSKADYFQLVGLEEALKPTRPPRKRAQKRLNTRLKV